MNRYAPHTVSAVAVLACGCPALRLATAYLLPFLNKPFLIDDPWFLTMAKQVIKHPAHPLDFEICWSNSFSDECRNASQFTSGNALMGQVAQDFVLVPTVWAAEAMAHVTQLLLVWIAVVAMTSLVLRFGWGRAHAIAGVLLIVRFLEKQPALFAERISRARLTRSGGFERWRGLTTLTTTAGLVDSGSYFVGDLSYVEADYGFRCDSCLSCRANAGRSVPPAFRCYVEVDVGF